MGRESLISYKAPLPTTAWHRARDVHMIFSVWIIHASQSIVWMCNYHTVDAVITALVCSPAALIWSEQELEQWSKVRSPILLCRGRASPLLLLSLWVSSAFHPPTLLFFFSFYFHYHLPAPTLSLNTVGGRCMLVPRWRRGVGEGEGGGKKSIVRVFEVFWKTSQGRRSCQGDR